MKTEGRTCWGGKFPGGGYLVETRGWNPGSLGARGDDAKNVFFYFIFVRFAFKNSLRGVGDKAGMSTLMAISVQVSTHAQLLMCVVVSR